MIRSKVTLGVVALVISAGTLTVMSPRTGEAQIGSTPVRVVNTPLPVSGNVNATVTGDVNATVTGNVGITPGSVVNVGNTAAAPVLVRNVDEAKQLTHGFAGCFFNGSICMIDIATVPDGKRLVIEHISGNINAFNDGIPNLVVGAAFSNCCISSNDNYLVAQQMPGSNRHAVNHQTLMFFDAGETVRVFIEKSTSNPGGAANFAYTGYLISQ